jgi:hypothetical protein
MTNDLNKGKDKLRFLKKLNLEWTFLGIILLFGFFIRVYRLWGPSLWIDEATSSMAAIMILFKGLPIFDSGLLYSRAYLFHYFQAFFLIFGVNDFFVRFPSVIFGLLTVLLAYFIGREYSKSGGILCALFMSVFYLEVFFSRQARFYQLFQLMFFLSIYLLYKSKDDKRFLYASLISLFITINVQIAGIILCPFFVIHIWMYNKPRWLTVIPLIPIIQKFMPVVGLSSESVEASVNYANQYLSFTRNIGYLLILFVPGVIYGFIKKKRLTLLIIVPSIVLLFSVFGLMTFAFRYAYFFVFPLVLYTSLLFSFLYEKYGNLMIIAILFVLLFPSNLFFPYTYVNVLIPVDSNFNDYSSPEVNFKDVPVELVRELTNNTLVCFFSSNGEWYIKKPDYVLPFSMDGIGEDEISMNNTEGIVVDRYSGALILEPKEKPQGTFYVIVDNFSASKLKPSQKENLEFLVEGCEKVYKAKDLVIWKCFGDG